MSRDGLFTTKASAVNKGGTPAFALFVSVMVAVLFIVLVRTFERVLAVLAFFFRRKLHIVVHFGFRVTAPRAEKKSPLSRLGISVDHSRSVAWLNFVSRGCNPERHSHQAFTRCCCWQ